MRDKIATLTAAIMAGPFEQPLWNSFLQQLHALSEATQIIMAFHPPGWAQDDSLMLMAGHATLDDIRKSDERFGFPKNHLRREWMEEGKAYLLADIVAREMPAHPNFFASMSRELGITSALNLRVQEASGVDAWLVIAKVGGELPSGLVELVEAITPVLRGTLRLFIARELDRFSAEMADEAGRRLQFGWIALDGESRVLSTDRYGGEVLSQSRLLARDPMGRLEVKSADLQAEIGQALTQLIRDPASRPRAIPLQADPWLDMLLVPARNRSFAAAGATAVIAYVHGDNWSASDRQAQLAELFNLSSSEARLALALCRGNSITEAAATVGLTVETARSYSKIIYAKTGARGQPDLVRIIMGSILAMAP